MISRSADRRELYPRDVMYETGASLFGFGATYNWRLLSITPEPVTGTIGRLN